MKSSITKRWVRGSLFFTLALVLVAEGVFLYFTISGYYKDVSQAIGNKFLELEGQLSQTGGTSTDDRYKRLIRTVEEFDAKTQFELMLVNIDGEIEATSSGVVPAYRQPQEDIANALRPGAAGTGQFIGTTETGEKVMAVTVRITPYAARGIEALRLVTSLTLVDRTILNIVVASVVLVLAIILASVVSGVYFIRSIVYPLQKVESSAVKIAQGDFDTRIATNTTDEIGRLCQTINHMAEELSKSEKMKNDFISSVSHELRTPLTSIKGWTETVGALGDPEDPNFRRGLEIISGEADRLYDMVEELLDFSRMQSGMTLSVELLDLAAEVENAVLLAGQQAAARGVALLYDIPEWPVPVMADKNRVRQVMVNVLDNAVKYSFPGGQIEVRIHCGDGVAIVQVEDEGQGISPEDLENVKVKFYKGTGAVRGSGIGLAVVDEIMHQHAGTLEIESEVQRGTIVTLCFPLHGQCPPEGLPPPAPGQDAPDDTPAETHNEGDRDI
ncbi:HAMP domain-containing histidine kinase [Ruminococcaceae bacterium OttesenSCG-928-O06]|nr:HAMP domain-containing histidine kinase [Ruminococcaceae bacterium OttesenSCG-928-O06]